MAAPDAEAARAGLLELAAQWTPVPLAAVLSQAMELSAWQGREEVYLDADDDVADEVRAFALDPIRLPFREQIAFLRQKRPQPTKVWLDALQNVHDRAFVVSGVTDTAMLEEFQAAIIDAAENGRYVDDFAKDFDRLVEKYGWDYRGERNWRIRTIFETNIRTSFMAGRLRQMRDPDVVKLRPYWQYLHGDSRTPKVPRKQHLSWNNLVLMWDDPWWQIHFPPNDWRCSCGVRTLSKRDLARLGKSRPDEAPKDALIPMIDKSTGKMIMQPQGIGFGWDYMPGDHWQRGLVPSELLADPAAEPGIGRHAVSIDTAGTMTDLVASSLPFASKPMARGLAAADYVSAFLDRFREHPDFSDPFFTDRAGDRLLISDELFRDRQGILKIGVGDRGPLAPLLAEAIIDPDEIWLGARTRIMPDGYGELLMTRRYIRVEPGTGLFASFDLGRRFWTGVTGFRPSKDYDPARPVKTNWSYLDHERIGKLLWKRK